MEAPLSAVDAVLLPVATALTGLAALTLDVVWFALSYNFLHTPHTSMGVTLSDFNNSDNEYQCVLLLFILVLALAILQLMRVFKQFENSLGGGLLFGVFYSSLVTLITGVAATAFSWHLTTVGHLQDQYKSRGYGSTLANTAVPASAFVLTMLFVGMTNGFTYATRPWINRSSLAMQTELKDARVPVPSGARYR